jgi:hypothetical protein
VQSPPLSTRVIYEASVESVNAIARVKTTSVNMLRPRLPHLSFVACLASKLSGNSM